MTVEVRSTLVDLLMKHVDTPSEKITDDAKVFVDAPSEKITDDAKVFVDVIRDSLEALEFVMVIEDHFGVEISDEQIEAVQTFGDLVRTVEGLVQ